MVDNDAPLFTGDLAGDAQWRQHQNQGWIESLTDLVLAAELAEGRPAEELMDICNEFVERALAICKLMHDLDDELEDEQAFADSLVAHNEALFASINSWQRGAGRSIDELCLAMYQFISLLAQRINFGERD